MQITAEKSIISGTVSAIPSKSYVHRILLCAMLSSRPTVVGGSSFPSDDIEATKECVVTLGCKIDGETVVPPAKLKDNVTVNCRESGSLLRFIIPIMSALGGNYSLTGTAKLLSRPLDELTVLLNSKGAKIERKPDRIDVSGKLQSGEYALRGDVSSQFITGLLLALPLLDGDSEIKLTTLLSSARYVDITLDVMRGFGVTAQKTASGFIVPGNQKYEVQTGSLIAEGDWSNAAFWIAAAALSGRIRITGLNLNSPQGDRGILDIVEMMGANVLRLDDAIEVSAKTLNAIEVDVDETIDLVPILSVLCANAQGTSILKNIKRLKFKESDRVSAIIHMINSLGGVAVENGNNLIVSGGGLKGGSAYSHNDHRIAMSAMIAALTCENNVIVSGAQAMNKSYPGFTEEYVRLGGKANVNMDGQ